MFCHHNSVTIEKLNSRKIIVLSPQPGDISKLTEKKEIKQKKERANNRNLGRQLTCRIYELYLGDNLGRLPG